MSINPVVRPKRIHYEPHQIQQAIVAEMETWDPWVQIADVNFDEFATSVLKRLGSMRQDQLRQSELLRRQHLSESAKAGWEIRRHREKHRK